MLCAAISRNMAQRTPQDMALNSTFLKRVQDGKNDVLSHPSFHNVENKRPESKGGLQKFNAMDMQRVLSDAQTVSDGKVRFKVYGPVCCNFFHLEYSTLSAGVPINQSNVQKLMEEKFKTPDVARGTTQPLIFGFLDADLQNDKLPNDLRLLSAVELVYALVLRLAECVDQLATEDELASWIDILTSYPVLFERHDSHDAMHWRSVNLREELATNHDLLSRSAVQKLFELIAFKVEEESKRSMVGSRAKTIQLSAKQLFELWQSNVKFSTLTNSEDRDRAGGGEMQFKLGFVEACIFVFNRLLIYPQVRDAILDAEDCCLFMAVILL